MSKEATDMTTALIGMNETFQPIIEAAGGFRANMEASGWSPAAAEAAALVYLKGMITLSFAANAPGH